MQWSIWMPDGESHANFRMPGDSHRTVIIGRTGSGKSVFGLHLLSHASIDRRPWLIIDHKGEPMLDGIDLRAMRDLNPGDKVPKEPGIYYVNPKPRIDDAAIEKMLWQIWERGRTGIYIDEAKDLPDGGALDSIMVQGRSLQIPCIVCTQRPVDISTYIFTQASFFAIFPVQRRRDQLHVEDYINAPKFMARSRLARHHCLWHDVEHDENMILQPAPDPVEIIDRLNLRAPHRFWW